MLVVVRPAFGFGGLFALLSRADAVAKRVCRVVAHDALRDRARLDARHAVEHVLANTSAHVKAIVRPTAIDRRRHVANVRQRRLVPARAVPKRVGLDGVVGTDKPLGVPSAERVRAVRAADVHHARRAGQRREHAETTRRRRAVGREKHVLRVARALRQRFVGVDGDQKQRNRHLLGGARRRAQLVGPKRSWQQPADSVGRTARFVVAQLGFGVRQVQQRDDAVLKQRAVDDGVQFFVRCRARSLGRRSVGAVGASRSLDRRLGFVVRDVNRSVGRRSRVAERRPSGVDVDRIAHRLFVAVCKSMYRRHAVNASIH